MQEPGAELLIDPPFISIAAAWIGELTSAASRDVHVSSTYRGQHRLLVLYGVGRLDRLEVAKRHRAAGGRLALWDLGYWSRNRSMRVGIDTAHPSAEQLERCAAMPPRPRPALAAKKIADPQGPILLCGLGPKSCVQLGLAPLSWERRKVEDLQIRYPGRTILHRPKPGNPAERLDGTKRAAPVPIEEAMRGCSLVVCRHSNVAVDACVAGVPVECDDGAAAALYRGNPDPSADDRSAFLAKLAWWNWGLHEAEGAWRFMADMAA